MIYTIHYDLGFGDCSEDFVKFENAVVRLSELTKTTELHKLKPPYMPDPNGSGAKYNLETGEWK